LNTSENASLAVENEASLLRYSVIGYQKGSAMNEESLNVLGTSLVPCSYDPLTGYFRDGCCNTDENDQGSHVVCAKVTQAFLDFSLQQGNDLVTPRPEHRFRGLKAGDRWCLCALRWKQAYMAGVAPKVVLESTHKRALDFVTLEQLKS
jgi:uncharacterized protein (DUF2237 family)